MQRVEQVVAPALEREGYELILVEYVPHSHVVRLFVDSADPERGVTVDDCGRLSPLVGDILDGEGISDEIDGRYTLEVSSPGLDRPLVRPEHFQRFVGREVKVTTHDVLMGRRKLTGELLAADAQGVRVAVEGKPVDVAYGMIARARLVPQL